MFLNFRCFLSNNTRVTINIVISLTIILCWIEIEFNFYLISNINMCKILSAFTNKCKCCWLNIFLWFNNKYNLIVIMLLQKSSYYSNSSYGASSNFNIHHLSNDTVLLQSFILAIHSLYKELAIWQAPAWLTHSVCNRVIVSCENILSIILVKI